MVTAYTDGFRWLPSYYTATRELPDQERLALYDAILDYGFGNEVGELSPLLRGYLELVSPTIEKSVEFYHKQKENGNKGGRPIKPKNNPTETQQKPNYNPEQTQTKPNGNLDSECECEGEGEGESESDIDSECEGERVTRARARFAPPSADEVKGYCDEKHISVDPERFIDFYTSKGWVVGKSPMKDWRAAVRNWARRGRDSPGGSDGMPEDIRDPKSYRPNPKSL